MPTNKKPIVVVEYSNNWKEEFSRIRDHLKSILGDLAIDIHHVGSTSIDDLAAKPVIDIDIEIENYSVFSSVVERLAEFGYVHVGDLGIEDREAFNPPDNTEFLECHLYVCPSYSRELRRHILFRDFLRSNEEYKNEYAQLKRDLAIRYRDDRDAYTESKTEFIISMLERAGGTELIGS